MGSTAGTALLDLLLVVGFAIAILLVDRVGRLPLQRAGFFGAALGLALLGVAAMSGNPMWLVIVGFALFNLMINAGPNSTTFLVPAEIYPTRLRATGHGFAAAAGKFGAALGVFVLPILQADVGTAAMVFAMAGVGLAGLAITSVFGQETRDVRIVGAAPAVVPAAEAAAGADLA
jgi:MFS family permease